MDFTQRASMSKKVKNFNFVLICIIGSISVLGFVMTIYSIIKYQFMFALLYLVAVILGFSYVVMKINAVIPTYVERNDDVICVQNWVNGLFPFVPDKGVLGEFFPAKSTLKKIYIASISKIYIGSKKYLSKIVKKGYFLETIEKYSNKYDNIMKHMEILYIKTVDNNEVFMSVTDFDENDLVEIFKPIIQENDKIEFKCGNRHISKEIPVKKITL